MKRQGIRGDLTAIWVLERQRNRGARGLSEITHSHLLLHLPSHYERSPYREAFLKAVPMHRVPADVIDTLLSIYKQQNLPLAAAALVDKAVRTHPTEKVWLRHKVDLARKAGRAGTIVAELQKLHRERRWSPEPDRGRLR